APSVGLFEQTYRELLETHEHVISLHISAALSGTHNVAVAAARTVAADRIFTVDSRSLSVCLGWLVEHAAGRGTEEQPTELIVSELEEMVPRLRLLGVLGTLEFVQRGGRIGKARALVG